MKYILTEEEYKKLTDKDEVRDMKYQIQELCTLVCNHMPITKGGEGKAAPWHCIRTISRKHYCDRCPVQVLCPYSLKKWSNKNDKKS